MIVLTLSVRHYTISLINVQRMCVRVTVVNWFVCLSVCMTNTTKLFLCLHHMSGNSDSSNVKATLLQDIEIMAVGLTITIMLGTVWLCFQEKIISTGV